MQASGKMTFGRKGQEWIRKLSEKLLVNSNLDEIKKYVENLKSSDPDLQEESLALLGEIGLRKPSLIAGFCREFLRLFGSDREGIREGAMRILSLLAAVESELIFQNLQSLDAAMRKGSPKTIEYGIKTLSTIAAMSQDRNRVIFPLLVRYLDRCASNSIVSCAVDVSSTINVKNKGKFIQILQEKIPLLSLKERNTLLSLLRPLKA